MKKNKLLIVLIIGLMLAGSMILAACSFTCPGNGLCEKDPGNSVYKYCNSSKCEVNNYHSYRSDCNC